MKRISWWASAGVLSLGFVLALAFAGCGKRDSLQSQTEWTGKCSQVGYEPYPMTMIVSERNGQEISGMLYWPSLRNSKTRFKAVVEDGDFYLIEYELIEGSGLLLPSLYQGRLMGETLGGTWRYAGHEGSFYLEKIKR